MIFQSLISYFRFFRIDASLKCPCDSRRVGFTIIELLVVISLIATIATLATGAAMKAVTMTRIRRVDATAQMLSMALENYRSLHGQWSFDPDLNKAKTGDGTFQTWGGKSQDSANNAEVFGSIFADVRQNRSHVDPSVLFTRVPQGRMTVKQALETGVAGDTISVGYPDPSNPNIFKYFKVQYNFITDSVTVSRDD